eukprot:50058-Alexandrium_andersonii.AAC.1
MSASLVGSEMCIRDSRPSPSSRGRVGPWISAAPAEAWATRRRLGHAPARLGRHARHRPVLCPLGPGPSP